ncbi:MAG: hydroxymethylbilane synthase [Pseudomonadota bacterium]
MILRIGTRGSKLALAQSRWVKARIEGEHPRVQVELVRIRTTGDKILDSPLSKIGGKGLFVKEIEDALLENRVDLAVHSMKDVPVELSSGLTICTFPEREDPHDALISKGNQTLDRLPHGSKVGTSSLRRKAQLLYLRSDLDLVPLRGNVDTRLSKLESGDLQAVILAAAGLMRLGLASRISERLSLRRLIPAVGQGALGLEVRRDDAKTIGLLGFINHGPTEMVIRAERAFLKEMEGGCQVPIAAFGQLEGEKLHLEGMVADLDGTRLLRDKAVGEKDEPELIGICLANRLLDSGGREILRGIYGKQ